QTLSVDTFFQRTPNSKDALPQRHFGWNASNDEVSDLEVPVIRGFFGGQGLLVRKDDPSVRIDLSADKALDGSTEAQFKNSAVRDWEVLVAFMKKIRTPRRPSRLDKGLVDAGRKVAEALSCGGCHGGSEWTISQ